MGFSFLMGFRVTHFTLRVASALQRKQSHDIMGKGVRAVSSKVRAARASMAPSPVASRLPAQAQTTNFSQSDPAFLEDIFQESESF